jgi:glycosyltransferase involved in cell wall biosynthesis
MAGRGGERIWFLSSSAGMGGGAERSLCYLIQATVEAGYEATLITPGEGVLTSFIERERTACRIERRPAMPTQLRTRSGWLPARVASMSANGARAIAVGLRLGFEAQRRGVGLIHCNNLMPNLLGGLAAASGAPAVVWHVRDIHTRAPRLAVQRSLAKQRRVKRIVCVSRAAAEQYRGVAEEKIRVVYNGIDCAEWDRSVVRPRLRSEYPKLARRFIIGCHGRLASWKGYELAIGAIAKLKESLPDIALVILGDSNPEVPAEVAYKRYLEALIDRLSLREHVFMLGYQADVRSFLADVDLYVLPSRDPDPFPRSVLEAMCLGLPIVASQAGGVPEALLATSVPAGRLFALGDSDALATAVAELYGARTVRDDLGEAAARTVREQFTLTRYCGNMLSVFREVLSEGNDAGSLESAPVAG